MEHKNGFILPCLTLVFKALRYISPLTLLTRLGRGFHRSWDTSHLAVEIYVVAWFCLLLFFIWLVATIKLFSPIPLVVISATLIWRLLDISQSWFNIFMKIKVEVLSPVRSLVLATINYFELSIIFGLLSFIFRYDNFNPTFVNVSQSLRHSIGVITTMGSRFDPASVLGGLLYYSEIAFGLAFLVVVISRVISLFKE